MATGSDKNVTFTVNATDKTKRGLSSAQKNLKKTSREATELSQRFRSVARATVILEGPLGGTAGRLSALATLFNSVNAGAVLAGTGVAALTAIAYQSLSAFADYEKQTAKIEQLLKQTGFASGKTAEDIERMSLEIGRATLASADDVRAASAVLLTFKSVAGDAFDRTMVVASDLAAVTGQDLKQSVIQLGKALEDPATGMSALRRSGVSFTNSQKDMIVAMKEAGDTAGAQAEILGLLEGQLGGAGAAQGKGLAGAADLVAENWNRMLISLAATGAGTVATSALNTIAEALQAIDEYLNPDEDTRLKQINAQLRTLYDNVNRNIEIYGKQAATININNNKQIAALVKERNEVERTKQVKKEASDAAIAASKVEQEKIAQLAEDDRKAAEQKKRLKEQEKQFEKESKEASTYAEKLIQDEDAFQTSLLNKGQMEDIYLEERLTKLQEYKDNKLISDDELHAAEQAAYQLHSAKLTEIDAEEKQKQQEAEAKLREQQLQATSAALGDISSLMSSSSKGLFKIGKGAAIANALINTYQAVTKTMASVPYPLNIPLAAAQTIAGLAQVQKIKSQQISAAKQLGGTTIGGRTYLVGERGPELFTPLSTGSIVNNNDTRNIGGNTNNISVTVVNDTGDEFVSRNARRIWDTILDKMNEEGLRFA